MLFDFELMWWYKNKTKIINLNFKLERKQRSGFELYFVSL